MQTTSSRTWTRISVSISSNDNPLNGVPSELNEKKKTKKKTEKKGKYFSKKKKRKKSLKHIQYTDNSFAAEEKNVKHLIIKRIIPFKRCYSTSLKCIGWLLYTFKKSEDNSDLKFGKVEPLSLFKVVNNEIERTFEQVWIKLEHVTHQTTFPAIQCNHLTKLPRLRSHLIFKYSSNTECLNYSFILSI